MNFLQYCLATKNYSAIDAVRCYAKNKGNVGKYVAAGLGGAALAGAPLGYMLHESNQDRDTARGERDTAVKDKESAVAAQKAAEQERDTAVAEHDKLKQESADWQNQKDELNNLLEVQRQAGEQAHKDAEFYKKKYEDTWNDYKHDHYITDDPRVHRFDTAKEAAYFMVNHPDREYDRYHTGEEDHPYMVVDRTDTEYGTF